MKYEIFNDNSKTDVKILNHYHLVKRHNLEFETVQSMPRDI